MVRFILSININNSRQQEVAYCILHCCHLIHRSNIKMIFLSQLFTFTDITGCVFAAAHLHLKRHALKQPVSASQNKHFQNDIINDLWGILSWTFTDTFWGDLILHLVKRDIIGAL